MSDGPTEKLPQHIGLYSACIRASCCRSRGRHRSSFVYFERLRTVCPSNFRKSADLLSDVTCIRPPATRTFALSILPVSRSDKDAIFVNDSYTIMSQQIETGMLSVIPSCLLLQTTSLLDKNFMQRMLYT